MRVLIVGDLMGAGAAEAPPIDQRPIVRVGVETVDEVFARFKPSVALSALGLQTPLAFESLDDFHPDALFKKVEIFDRLRTLRQSGPAPTEASEEKTGALLDRLLGTKARLPSTPQGSNESRAVEGVEAFIRSLVAPHIVAEADPRLPQFVSAVDAAIADTMRSLLHDRAFQRLEATWRGVQWLLAGTGEIDEADLEVSLLHLTREELSVQAHQDSPLGLRLEAGGADGTPWSLVVADVAFGPSAGDLETLRGLGELLGGLGIPLVAAAQGTLVGCKDVSAQADPKSWSALPADVAPLWAELRTMPEGRFLGLTWPRLILRLPYGKKSDPIDAFEFEELPTDHDHEDYLWGNGAFAAALTMARTYVGGAGGLAGDIGDLPAFTYAEHGEPTMKPCAEFCMTERAADEVLARGIMPLVSYKTRNAVRVIRLQSISATALGGPSFVDV